MRLSFAFLLLFVCLSYQQGLQRWPYRISPPPHHATHQDQLTQDYKFFSRRNLFNYPSYHDEEYYPSRRPYFFNQGRPPLLAIDEEENIAYFPIDVNQQSYLGESRTSLRPKLKNKSPETPAYDPFLLPNVNEYNDDDQVESRLFFGQNNANSGNGIAGNIASLLNPFAYGYVSNLPYIANPNRPIATISSGSACTGSDGEPGTCQLPAVCNILGRQSSGSCGSLGARVCCLNVISKCGQTVTANNTVWQQPGNFSGISSCDLTVKLSDTVNEDKKKPICQVRLDFTKFVIEQPNVNTVCDKDVFSITGTQNNPADICGENDGQHMYLNIPSTAVSSTDLKLSFKVSSTSTLAPSWKIKIALLPCGANYLAPSDCLQYFTDRASQIKSFNWKDSTIANADKGIYTDTINDPTNSAPLLRTRQLANQKQNICIRPQSSSIRRICYSTCAGTLPFSLSVANYLQPDGIYAPTELGGAELGSYANLNQFGIRNCNNDYLVIPGAFSQDFQTSVPNQFILENPNFGDRFCGERLSSLNVVDIPRIGDAVSGTSPIIPADTVVKNQVICTELRPFILYYRTNGDEILTPTADIETGATTGRGNQGFCLSFTQSS